MEDFTKIYREMFGSSCKKFLKSQSIYDNVLTDEGVFSNSPFFFVYRDTPKRKGRAFGNRE